MPDIVSLAIEMGRTCLALQVLPRAGGLLDQDARDVFFIQVVAAADHEKSELDAKVKQEMNRGAGNSGTSSHYTRTR